MQVDIENFTNMLYRFDREIEALESHAIDFSIHFLNCDDHKTLNIPSEYIQKITFGKCVSLYLTAMWPFEAPKIMLLNEDIFDIFLKLLPKDIFEDIFGQLNAKINIKAVEK